jgi:D-aminopeptidase
MAAATSVRAHGLRIGELEPGPLGSIADVSGVRVGHVTVRRDEPEPPAGRGVARTGVTAIAPADPATLYDRPLAAGVAVLNGAGEMTGAVQTAEWGIVETPIYLTSTMAVGRVYDGAVAAAVAADPLVGVENVVIPVVSECDDSWLSDARTVQVEAEDAGRALDAADTLVEQGCVGAGTGMVCFDWKGGIGTSSRMAGSTGWTVGVLVLANFGDRHELRVDGVPVGRLLSDAPGGGPPSPGGSCIAIVATDAPASAAQLTRLARRAGLGLARTGSVAHDASGEIFLAFSTTTRVPRGRIGAHPADVPDEVLNTLFAATVDATEEAVLNALWNAERTTGREGRVVEALPHDDVLELLGRHGRLGA